MDYKASKGVIVKIITIGSIVLFVLIGYKNLLGIINAKGHITPILIHSGWLVFFMAIIAVCYLLAPQKYSIDSEYLTIHRPLFVKKISLFSITEVREVEKQEMIGSIRTFGVGGFFGNFGEFYSNTLGNFTLYGTQNKNYVLIKTDSKKIMITPNDMGIILHLREFYQS